MNLLDSFLRPDSLRDYLIRSLFLASLGAILFFALNPDKAERKRQRMAADEAMSSECMLHCAVYGIQRSDLLGPELLHEMHIKQAYDYVYAWTAPATANRPTVTLTIHGYANSAISPKTDATWLMVSKPAS